LADQSLLVADQPSATTGTDAAAHGLGRAAAANLGGAADAGSADGQGRASAVGPDATGTARVGLCRAWQAGPGAHHGRRMDAVAFRALAEAAGGADHIAAYCQDGPGVAAERVGPADQRLATFQRPPRGPGPARQHRPWRARAGRSPDHQRLTHPIPPTTARPAEPTAGGRDGRAPRHPPAPT
jgi:hypothetical protein